MSIYGSDDMAAHRVAGLERASAFQTAIFEEQQAHRPPDPTIQRNQQELRQGYCQAQAGQWKQNMKSLTKQYDRQYKLQKENRRRKKRGLPPLEDEEFAYDPEGDKKVDSASEENEEEEEENEEEETSQETSAAAASSSTTTAATTTTTTNEKDDDLRVVVKTYLEKEKEQHQQQQQQKSSTTGSESGFDVVSSATIISSTDVKQPGEVAGSDWSEISSQTSNENKATNNVVVASSSPKKEDKEGDGENKKEKNKEQQQEEEDETSVDPFAGEMMNRQESYDMKIAERNTTDFLNNLADNQF